MALTAEEFEDKTVRSLKSLVFKQFGVSRFRQRWLSESHTELQDHDFVTASDVHMVILPFVQSEDEEAKELYRELYFASLMNDSDRVSELLRKPLNPDIIDHDRSEWKTALHMAAGSSHIECVALLLEAGADKDLADFEGTTALQLAAQNDAVEIVRLLLEAKTKVDKAVDDSNLQKAVRVAVEKGHSEVAKLLLVACVDRHVTDSDERTALNLAVEETAEVLLEAQADKGAKPLLVAAAKGHSEVVKLLLETGLEKDLATPYEKTALRLAVENGHVEIVRLLLEAKGKSAKFKVHKYAAAYDLDKALLVAAAKGHSEVVKLLLEAGADDDLATPCEQTALELAVENGHVEVVRLLLEAMAKFEGHKYRVASNLTKAMRVAAAKGLSEVLELLLVACADNHVTDSVERTALHLAVEKAVELLLEAQADKYAAAYSLDRALVVAAAKGYLGVVKLLLVAGADTDAVDSFGITALRIGRLRTAIQKL